MPRVSWDTEAQWQSHYWRWIDGVQTFYSRAMYDYGGSMPKYERNRDLLISTLGITTTDRILIAGCGFGFLIEAFHKAGYSNCWGIDYSAHIASNRATESDGTVLFVENDIRGGGQVRNALRQMSGLGPQDGYHYVISENMLESYDLGTEMEQLLDAAESVLQSGEPLSNVAHLVQAVRNPSDPDRSIDPAFLQLTLAEWNAIRPAHTWIDITTGDSL